MKHGTGRNRGEASAQLVIVLPLVVLVLLLAIQSALYFHVSHVAGAAAAQGASAASANALSSTEATRRGRDESDSLVRETGSKLAYPTLVTVSSGEVRVTVRVVVPRIVPYFPEGVVRTAVQPRERFVTEPQR